MKKKVVAMAIAFAVLLTAAGLFAACSGGGNKGGGSGDGNSGGGETLTGTSEEVLSQVTDAATAKLGDENPLPPTLTNPITSENADGMLGLIPSDFDKYVEEATSATGALTTSAFEIAVVKCKDAAAASEVMQLIAGGFDSAKWICVAPEQSIVSVSGSYVLLAVGGKAETEALVGAFDEIADAPGSEVFFTRQM